MNIRYIAQVHVPSVNASGIQITHTCEAIALLGHDVELIVLDDVQVTGDLFDYYCVKRVFRVTPLAAPRGGMPQALGMRAGRFHAIRALRAAKRYLRREPYDALYTREPLVGLLFTHHVLEIHTLPGRVSFFNKLLWKRAGKIVVITHALKRRLVEHGVPSNKILVAPDGVDVEKFAIPLSRKEARGKLSLPLEGTIVVYTGSVLSRTGRSIELFLDVARELSPDILLYVVGPMDEAQRAYLASRQHAIPNLVVIGPRPHQEMPLWQKAADVLLLHNTANELVLREYTSPMKLFEYMAAGTPIVASDLPSTREILDDQSALLVVPDDAQALASGIRTLVNDEERGRALAARARAAVTQFSWEHRAERILSFICERAP